MVTQIQFVYEPFLPPYDCNVNSAESQTLISICRETGDPSAASALTPCYCYGPYTRRRALKLAGGHV